MVSQERLKGISVEIYWVLKVIYRSSNGYLREVSGMFFKEFLRMFLKKGVFRESFKGDSRELHGCLQFWGHPHFEVAISIYSMSRPNVLFTASNPT